MWIVPLPLSYCSELASKATRNENKTKSSQRARNDTPESRVNIQDTNRILIYIYTHKRFRVKCFPRRVRVTLKFIRFLIKFTEYFSIRLKRPSIFFLTRLKKIRSLKILSYDRDDFFTFFIKFKNEFFEPRLPRFLAKRGIIVRGRRTKIFFPVELEETRVLIKLEDRDSRWLIARLELRSRR